MGIDYNGLNFLVALKKRGVDFSNTITLGRQNIHIKNSQLKHILQSFGHSEINLQSELQYPYAEETFMTVLNSSRVDSLDASSYENASIIHDLNNDINEELKNKYTAVIDSGTLEHVFNFPKALKSAMEIVKLDGHFISITPGNNFLGHGFYQFSPELFYSTLNSNNGFKVEWMIAYEDKEDSDWYEVSDPDEIKSRVTLSNRIPLYLGVCAKRVSILPIFLTTPQQSDYLNVWNSNNTTENLLQIKPWKGPLWIKSLFKLLPFGLQMWLKRVFNVNDVYLRFNPRMFKKVSR